ncbi:agamous-like MADS-box protein AGL62 [Quillaja saponaria]|uniref:Agamous-like MADS-box protein AGL62 n=1 Tax=Quillaja saponaria TaxID=32244 RepID=A0AAD7KY55_QUISA|nr:agamous-like MADS-box protein AGL62 [Quillaja saponaria]
MDESKKTKGKKKIEIKKIEKEDDLLVTFSKRRSGIYKKANEIVTLCGAEVAFLAFSPTGKPYSFAHPSMECVTNSFLNQNSLQDDKIHSIFETYNQSKIDELTKEYNELVDKLQIEREKMKALKQLARERDAKGWWETPLNDLSYPELKQMEASFIKLYNNLANQLNETSGGASSHVT